MLLRTRNSNSVSDTSLSSSSFHTQLQAAPTNSFRRLVQARQANTVLMNTIS